VGNFVKHYTYCHSAPNGKVFYIGKGVDNRAYSFGDRSVNWKQAVIYHKGLSIEKLAYWETEEEAFEHEKFLIWCFQDMQNTLVNLTGGGKGPYKIQHSEDANRKRSEKNKGYVHKKITCTKCGKHGGETSMRRWHFEKCVGIRPFKARVTIDGKRIYLGKFSTKEEADAVISMAYKQKGLNNGIRNGKC
jgi:hypothetical protein